MLSESKEMSLETSTEAMQDQEGSINENEDGMFDENDKILEQTDDLMGEKNDAMGAEGSMKKDDHDMGDEDMEDDDAMMEEKDDGMGNRNDDSMMDDNKDDDMSDESMVMTPEWLKTTLTDVSTGETFRIVDFQGKVVLIETLAIWCSNCAKQQQQVKTLHEMIGEREDFVSLGIDIDPNESAEALGSYVSNKGFDWLYVVAPTEVSREISQLYGNQFLNPPSTPMMIIDREGSVHPLPFGIKNAESLLEYLQPFLDAEM
jgi:hypothetical protein